MDLITKEYRTITYISGPLLFLENVRDLPYGSMIEIILPTGEIRNGQVMEIYTEHVLIQILEITAGKDIAQTSVRLKENESLLPVAPLQPPSISHLRGKCMSSSF